MSFQKPLVLIILSLTLFSFSNCGSTKVDNDAIAFQENPPFKIENATSQQTIAGIKEGGTSTRLTLPTTAVKDGVVFKNLYFNGQMVEVTPNPIVKTQYMGVFTTGKDDFIMDNDPIKEAQNTSKKTFPFNLKDNEAAISYMYQNKLCYYMITNLKTLPPIALPSQNPNGLNKL